eukprot:5851172-Amphidinium_carterae.1
MTALEPRGYKDAAISVGAALVPFVAMPGSCLSLKAVPAVAVAWLVRAIQRWRRSPEREAPVVDMGSEEACITSELPTFPTSPPLPDGTWGRRNGWWVDSKGRKIIPRGVNFAGNSKLPAKPDFCRGTHLSVGRPEVYTRHREVSFVGRPCPLEEVSVHLLRMRTCGFNIIRLLVTWESLEHAGPMQYDEEHMAYIRAV